MSERTLPRVAVVDYGAGNLRSVERGAEGRRGAAGVVDRGTDRRIAGAGALVVPGVGAAARRWSRLRRHGLDADPRRGGGRRRFLGICLGLQLLFERSDEDGAETAGPPARPRRAASPTRRGCPTSAGTRSSGAEPIRCRRHPRRHAGLLRPPLRGRPADPRRSSSPRRPTAAASRASWPAAGCSAPSSTPSDPAPTACGSWPTSSGWRQGGPAPSRSGPRTRRRAPPDAAATGHPLPRRGRRPGREGHPVRRPGRRGRPGRAGRAVRGRGRGRARVPRHRRGARGARHALDVDPCGPRIAGLRAADRGRRRAEHGRDARRAAGRGRQGGPQHGGGRRSGPDQAMRGALRPPVRRRRDRRAGAGAGRGSGRSRRLGGRRPGRPDGHRPRRVEWAERARSSWVPASCWSPRSTGTAHGPGFDLRCSARSPRAWSAGHRVGGCRAGRRHGRRDHGRAARMRCWPPRSSTAASCRSAQVKAGLAAAGVPVAAGRACAA